MAEVCSLLTEYMNPGDVMITCTFVLQVTFKAPRLQKLTDLVLNLPSSVWQHLLAYLLNRMNQQQQRRNISLVNDGMKSTIAASFQILPCLSPSLLVDNEVCSLSGTISEVNVEEEDEEEDGVGGE